MFNGHLVDVDATINNSLAVCHYNLAIDRGSSEAETTLAALHLAGLCDLEKNDAKALELFQRAAMKGCDVARHNMQWMQAHCGCWNACIKLAVINSLPLGKLKPVRHYVCNVDSSNQSTVNEP